MQDNTVGAKEVRAFLRVCMRPGSIIPKTIVLKRGGALPGKAPVTFNPDAKIDAGVAHSLVKANPRVFAIIPDDYEIDLGQYTVNQSVTRTRIEDILAHLSPEDVERVVQFANQVASGDDQLQTEITAAEVAELVEDIKRSNENVRQLNGEILRLEGVIQSLQSGKESADALINELTEKLAASKPSYEKWTAEALRDEAKEREIAVPANASKPDLIALLSK